MTGMTTTVGEFLRKTRTERGISLEQVAQATRVKLAYLQAIEQNEPSEMPSVVQARGFLRLYASFLDLPAQPLLYGWQSGHYVAPEAPLSAPETPAPLIKESASNCRSRTNNPNRKNPLQARNPKNIRRKSCRKFSGK